MKKILLFAICFIVFLSISVSAMELEWVSGERYSSVYIGKDIGLVYNETGSAVINKFGQTVTPFSENEKEITPNGLVAVLGDNNFIGFYNNKGEQITDFIYDAFIDTHEKSKITRIGYLSNMGYPHSGDGSSDLLPVSLNGKFGYINSYGTTVIPHKYEYAYGFFDGIALICADGILSDYGTYTNGKYGFIKENGEEILPANSYWVASYFDTDWGYATASNGVSDSVFVDKEGNVYKADEKGFAPAADYVCVSENWDRYAVYDKSGNIVVPWTYCYGISYLKNRFVYNNGIYNTKNELLYQAPEGASIFDRVANEDKNFMYLRVPNPEIEGLAFIGVIDYNGNTVIEPKYQTALDLGEGLIYARSETENYLFDYSGKLLTKLNGQVNYSFSHNGFFAMYDFDTMKYGIAVNPLVHPKVYLNNEKVAFTDAYPFIENSRTLVPLRAVFEKLGAEVLWEDETQTVTVKKDDKIISMTVGSNVIKVNQNESEIDISPCLSDDRVYIPLRAFSESLGLKVLWDENNYVVNLEGV